MWILALNLTHDASMCLMKDSEIILHLKEERLNHIPHSRQVVYCIDLIKNYTDKIDYVVFGYLHNHAIDHDPYIHLFTQKGISVGEMLDCSKFHHVIHSYGAFCNSGFKDAVCLVVDGAGSDIENFDHKNNPIVPLGYEFKSVKENESIYEFDSFEVPVCLYKTAVGYNSEVIDDFYPNYWEKNKRIGIGMVYAVIADELGWTQGEGKVMGRSLYGKFDLHIKTMMTKKGANESLFHLRGTGKIQSCGASVVQYDYIKDIVAEIDTAARNLAGPNNFDKISNLCYKIQIEFEKYMMNLIKKSLELSKSKNLILTGGCALNCLANYKFLKQLPEDINLYVDPVCADDGISLAMAKYAYVKHQGTNNKTLKDISLKTLYLGQPIKYEYFLNSNESEIDVTPKEVAELISHGNIVAICQGRSESGPRALGNRSILFDPRVQNGKEIVNKVKKREWWRPFAGTVLLEHAKEWFDMNRLEESPYMMYAVEVLKNKRKQIPAITHIDGTCRIQTVTEEQNKNYYNLINEFYKITGVPILFNTSFNLSGDTIAETIDDAFKTVRNSDIEYMYLPEIQKLVKVPNE
jgi:carbamoyltransferase